MFNNLGFSKLYHYIFLRYTSVELSCAPSDTLRCWLHGHVFCYFVLLAAVQWYSLMPLNSIGIILVERYSSATGDSTFREKVKRDLNFDPNRHYEDMMFLELRLDESGLPENGAEWVVQTAREQHDADRAGDTSLVEQVEKLPKKKPE